MLNMLLGALLYVGLLCTMSALLAIGDGRFGSRREWLERWRAWRHRRQMWGDWTGDPQPQRELRQPQGQSHRGDGDSYPIRVPAAVLA